MAGDEKPARHVGRLTDPSVREDGVDEPQVEADASLPPPDVATASAERSATDEAAADAAASSAESRASSSDEAEVGANVPSSSASAEPTPTPGFARTGHPVRDRLLAKAAAAGASRGAPTPGDDASPRFGSLGELGDELDEIAIRKGPRTPNPVKIAGTALSASSLTVFGTLIGLAAIASLFALLMQFSPREPSELPTEVVPVQQTATPAISTALPLPTVAPPPPRKKLEGPWRIGSAGTGEKVIRGKIGQQPFLKAVQEAGLEKSQAYRAYTALKDEKNLDRCRPSDEFAALLDSTGHLKAFEYIVDKEEIYQAKTGDDGLLKGSKLDMKVRKNRVQGAMLMTSASFAEAAARAHFDASLGRHLNKALEGHTSVAQFQRGDRLRVVAQEVTVLGEFSRYAGIEALEYLPASGKPLRIYYLPSRKKYYDAKGRAPGEGGWRKPVKGPITSKFNPKRMHPILKKRMPHNGTDFGAPTGTPVYASSYGTITKRGDYGPNGNFIAIEHPNGYSTGYSHLSRFEPGLKVGDQVKRMQVIGYVGSTGRSTGPHLHFSARKDGAYIDPESLHLDALTTLPPSERAQLNVVRQRYDAMLETVALPPALEAPASVADSAPDTEPPAEMGDSQAGTTPPAAAVTSVASPATPAAPPAAVVATPSPSPVQPAAAPAGNTQAGNQQPTYGSVYLSDKELIQAQAGSDDGEVEE